MAVTLKQLEEELARKRTEISELEIAVRVLRRMDSANTNGKATEPHTHTSSARHSPPPPPPANEGFSGNTMAECAEIVLREKGTLHYKEVAAIAMSRGYKSPRGGDNDAIKQSFWATMNRAKDTFKSEGDGKYSLIQKRDETA